MYYYTPSSCIKREVLNTFLARSTSASVTLKHRRSLGEREREGRGGGEGGGPHVYIINVCGYTTDHSVCKLNK